mmetsp:Transcript_23431/g.32705  ORF Transcript_23431/g.32705 Transcript_23431/m.32705 type:complete len:264 (-) Transcript_23431:113-904(-)|eukprot:CAMPEP_0184478602 /NCGR_PEP_ID=MMETSP0113_2-20130426/585_1 /TAXON_ID=91329 /ORGANISM="Norrisiella sphaerica, Strain BC52" /LENGTH=263 /DNA_ID=CAMNT_0026856455 /DNA_START=180 /DNA_END=971 /DNA_ORIENTATION=-
MNAKSPEHKLTSGDYLKADALRVARLESKASQNRKELRDLRSQRKKIVASIQKKFELEAKRLLESWQFKLDEIAAFHQEKESILKEGHEERFKKAISTLETKIPDFKMSPQLQKLRTIEKRLYEAQNFVEAAEICSRADEVEKNERAFHAAKTNRTTTRKVNMLKRNQANELEAFNLRRDAAITKLESERDKELDRLRRKYKNLGLRTDCMMRVNIAKRTLQAEKWATAVRTHEAQVAVDIPEEKDVALADRPSRFTTRKLVL